MDFYGQVLLELVMALGAALIIGNVLAIIRRRSDRQKAIESLQGSSRPSRQKVSTLAKHAEKQGTTTLAVAPLGRSVIYLLIGVVVFVWAFASRFG